MAVVRGGRRGALRRELTETLKVLPGGMLDTQKPPPPDDLTKEEAKIWISIVDVLPYDWFSAENYPLLGATAGT